MQVQAQPDHKVIGPLDPDARPDVVSHEVPDRRPLTGQTDKRLLTSLRLGRLHLGVAFWVTGFVAGFVFWQHVGFWGLIQSVFYSGGGADQSSDGRVARAQFELVPSVVIQRHSGPNNAPQNVGLLSVKLSADNCTSLLLDRTERTMVTAPCSNEVMPLNSLRAARKDDRRIPVAEAKAAATAAVTSAIAVPVPNPAKVKTAPVAPAVASWSSTVVTSPAR